MTGERTSKRQVREVGFSYIQTNELLNEYSNAFIVY